MFETYMVEGLECVACGQKFEGLVIHGVPDDVCSTVCMIDLQRFRARQDERAIEQGIALGDAMAGKFSTTCNTSKNFPP